jgi:hypothetical protein
VRNLALEQRERFDRKDWRISCGMQAADLKALKDVAPFLREVPHHTLHQALLDLRHAIERWRSGAAGRPRYKGRYAGDSFRFPDPKQFPVLAIGLKLPKAGLVPWIKCGDPCRQPARWIRHAGQRHQGSSRGTSGSGLALRWVNPATLLPHLDVEPIAVLIQQSATSADRLGIISAEDRLGRHDRPVRAHNVALVNGHARSPCCCSAT